jgi:glycosyltransferase involved in cell wall biosynthesis
MKRILFFIESLQCGGAEKSLVSLLNSFDFSAYELRIMVLNRGGEFEKFVPKHLSIESIKVDWGLFSRLKFRFYKLIYKNRKFHPAQLFWQCTKKDVPIVKEKYDLAIAWGQGFATYFVAERTIAHKKIAWVNTDYHKAGYNWKRDLPIYNKFDKVVGVSEFVKQSMQVFLNNEKVVAIRDIIDPNDILVRAEEDSPALKFDKNIVNLVSVGRLSKPKGFELALAAAQILVMDGHSIHWYIIGEGAERNYLEALINESKLNHHVTLFGFQENPYPYIKACDIYVQTSWFEGLSITLIEAKILCKPIVTTDFPTAKSILEHEKTGLITSMDASSIASAIKRIIEDDNLKGFLVKNLQSQVDNEKRKTLAAIYNLFAT